MDSRNGKLSEPDPMLLKEKKTQGINNVIYMPAAKMTPSDKTDIEMMSKTRLIGAVALYRNNTEKQTGFATEENRLWEM